jgi:hypothetical protein
MLATVMAVAYLVMSIAAASHSFLHVGDHTPSSEKGTASAVGTHAADHSDHGAPAGESGASHCFFCAYAPTVLLLGPIALLFGLIGYHRPSPSPIRERRLTPPALLVISLRAPPVA